MGLESYTPKTEAVQFPGGEFAVRGLALEDITGLLQSHYEPISALFDKYIAEAGAGAVDKAIMGGKLGLGDIKFVLLEALQHAPGLIAEAVARAADEMERLHTVRTLPTGVQLDAASKVIQLTLEAEGGMEKLIETVSRLAASMARLTADRSQ